MLQDIFSITAQTPKCTWNHSFQRHLPTLSPFGILAQNIRAIQLSQPAQRRNCQRGQNYHM